jgi:hypothetical protein
MPANYPGTLILPAMMNDISICEGQAVGRGSHFMYAEGSLQDRDV